MVYGIQSDLYRHHPDDDTGVFIEQTNLEITHWHICGCECNGAIMTVIMVTGTKGLEPFIISHDQRAWMCSKLVEIKYADKLP